MKAIVRAGALLTALLVTACAGIGQWGVRQPVDPERAAELAEARELVAALGARNRNLTTFKGIGRFKLWQSGRLMSSRAAWVGVYPDKLRIAVMNAAGQPMASLATDGQNLYMVSHAEGEFYKRATADATLQRLIAIPISARDIISMLTLRLPIREHHSAELTRNGDGRGYTLTLARKWRGVSEKIYLDTDKRSVLQIEIFESTDNLSYRAVFSGKQPLADLDLPEKIMISDADGNRCELEIDRYWTDVPAAPSTFVLTPP